MKTGWLPRGGRKSELPNLSPPLQTQFSRSVLIVWQNICRAVVVFFCRLARANNERAKRKQRVVVVVQSNAGYFLRQVTPGADARQACARKLRVPDAFAHRLTWTRSRKFRGCSPTSTYSTLTMHVSAASRAATVAARSLRRPLATLNNAPPAGKRCVLCTVFTL